MNNKPLVSIIIPTYNRAHLIEETLESILEQTYKNWECIIVDDGSMDNIEEVIFEHLKKDFRFQFHRRPNNYKPGGNGARNYGFEISKGEYLNFFDSDDLMHPEKIKMQLDALMSSNKDFAICQTTFFKTRREEMVGVWNENLYDENPIDSFILKQIGWSTSAPLWKKESLIKHYIKFDERLKNGQDFKFHIEVLLKGLNPIVVHENLVANREHDNQIKSRNTKTVSKTLIFRFLYDNRYRLRDDTNTYVETALLSLIPRLYIDKNLRKAFLLSVFMLRKEFSVRVFIKIVGNALFGSLYYLTNKGYRFLSNN
ncbi:glycosyltransferase involved in cell wall biosynthesis [Flavobacterium arsenatis]|uniref:Glycosyltransferase involved in cell wall biosynthesis n=1 Tax=Flavobacterium arsenatis TaxID=1484332 RepID=A0ABU1TM00_9FLAO|nr:glycosyltransferase family 2 protein [Flavobacterium arsenatis]MDR6966992.1 glycosyltransferase involved in cell wall biosynthesis [Flavobacterium arsenatis]